ncbi:MAG: asparaginase [Pseudomonadota bacterium]|nr:asparaginase [Pseudomonadota bacterium]
MSAEFVPMIEIVRGEHVESMHFGAAVIFGPNNRLIAKWGNVDVKIYPRSSIKMIQALPLIASGAFEHFGLGSEEIALACASHEGSTAHTVILSKWLSKIGAEEADLKCGEQPSQFDKVQQTSEPKYFSKKQITNNCSGKHCGFLTYRNFMKLGEDYLAVSHPLQMKIRETLEYLSEEPTPNYGIDGCSAPNFICSINGLAKSMAKIAVQKGIERNLGKASKEIFKSMRKNPQLVAGAGRACTELMMAARTRLIVKTGAEGVFTAACADNGIGLALKIMDGSTRASEAAVAAILVKLGLLDESHPLVAKRLFKLQKNWNGFVTGYIRPAEPFWESGKIIVNGH